MGEILLDEKALTPMEQNDLDNLERVIQENFLGFVAVGKALAEIRDRRLYRNDQGRTFEGYCTELWDMCRSRAYQLIDSAKAVENVHNCRQNNPQLAEITTPQNEAQARELAKLKPEDQVIVWQRVAEEAQKNGGRVTARLVKNEARLFVSDEIGKTIRQSTDRQEKAEKMSEAFAKAWNQLWRQVDEERLQNWRHTSRLEVYKRTSMLLEALADTKPTGPQTPEIPLGLSNREKLSRAGFTILRMRSEAKVIERWDRDIGWMVMETAERPTELLGKFKKLLEDQRNIKG